MERIDEWRIISEDTVFSSEWFNVRKTHALLPTGVSIDDYYVIDNRDAVMIAATDSNKRIVLKQEYRLPVKRILFELPAGAIEKKDASILDAAKRELLEETGFFSDNWIYLGETYDCPERCTAKLHLFWAKDSYKVSDQHLDESEDIACHPIEIKKAVRMCFRSEVMVNSCIHAILKVAYLLNRI